MNQGASNPARGPPGGDMDAHTHRQPRRRIDLAATAVAPQASP